MLSAIIRFLHNIRECFTVLYCTVLYCTVLYCTVLCALQCCTELCAHFLFFGNTIGKTNTVYICTRPVYKILLVVLLINVFSTHTYYLCEKTALRYVYCNRGCVLYIIYSICWIAGGYTILYSLSESRQTYTLLYSVQCTPVLWLKKYNYSTL